MTNEVERNSINEKDDNLSDEDVEKEEYLSSFIERLLSAPMKNNGKSSLVDISIKSDEVRIISLYSAASLISQNSLLRIDEETLPIHIVGDLHGQFNDLRMIFARCGHPPLTNYVFLGDYVDRGMQGLETSMLLMALQALWPRNVYLLRGNHEDYNTTLTYGFYDECRMKFGTTGYMVWLHMINAFNNLPFAALIFDRILCMHGGISPNMSNISDIEQLARPTFIPSFGLACDLLWADPECRSKPGFALSARGISFSFDDSIIEDFCKTNDIDTIVRAHQITSEMYTGGHKIHANGRMITVFSAPNYLNMGNDSCVIRVSKNKTLKFVVFRPDNARKKKSNKNRLIND